MVIPLTVRTISPSHLRYLFSIFMRCFDGLQSAGTFNGESLEGVGRIMLCAPPNHHFAELPQQLCTD
jgi:hypothetical protein